MAELLWDIDTDGLGDYTSLNAWEAANQQNLVSAGDWAHPITRASSGSADTTILLIDDWTTSPTNNILIEAADGDQALKDQWDATRYRISSTQSGEQQTIRTNVSNVEFKGLQIFNSGNLDGTYAMYLLDAITNIVLDSCRIEGACRSSIYTNNGSLEIEIKNTIIKDSRYGLFLVNQALADLYNCVITNTVTAGVRRNSGIANVVNCAVFDNPDDFDGSFTSINYCASDDGDGTNAQSPSGADWDNEFVDYLNGDFTAIGTGNIQNGVGPSVDVNVPVLDIDGDTRSGATAYIGVDEFQAGGTIFNVSISDTATATDSYIGLIDYLVSISDTATATDSYSGLVDYLASLSDTATATDLYSSGANILNLSVSETATATDVFSGTYIFNITLSDTATATDILDSLAVYGVDVSEIAAAVDSYSSGDLIDGRMCVTITGVRASITITGTRPGIDITGEGCE
jgi:hypothetical protein